MPGGVNARPTPSAHNARYASAGIPHNPSLWMSSVMCLGIMSGEVRCPQCKCTLTLSFCNGGMCDFVFKRTATLAKTQHMRNGVGQ